MKKFYLLAATVLMAGSAFAEDVTVGISRPLVPGTDAREYDTFAYITTADFNNSVDGLTVSFYQSPEIEATLAKDETSESGYEKKDLCYRGQKYGVDYIWKIQCVDYAAGDKDTKGSENYKFGFDLTVADGKTFTVSGLDLLLLVEQNPSWCITIVDASGKELYNSTWYVKSGSYNGDWGYGFGATITTSSVAIAVGPKVDITDPAQSWLPTEVLSPTQTLIPENLVLASGSYKVLCDVDYNNENLKGISFDHLTIEGALSGETTGISSITSEDNATKDGAIYNLAGQRVSTPVSGQLYIQNGKKYIKK